MDRERALWELPRRAERRSIRAESRNADDWLDVSERQRKARPPHPAPLRNPSVRKSRGNLVLRDILPGPSPTPILLLQLPVHSRNHSAPDFKRFMSNG